ncbi:NAD(P)H-hydrate dehydratase [Sphingomonas bacterium]|uniref:NAD(P)H-hydrate dehydratase n=1 Tax=Sphingomonas bacterium TaxID=1895847 RepID=UPI002602FB14|nr:NAD(P)H-hydrate dehydratase [Sphingomonas bacterium]MDB5678906.1 bifunctional ADP-dependent (S)-NAD(P)H-hydrate dehydratase/NAD(P)H-hydrate epimerase [Sphingomonas bacterium]
MIPIEGQLILTAAEIRAAEERAIAAGSNVEELMERAGAGVAEAVRRLAAGAPVLILCGPGNNGGDGYVAARILRANGVAVRAAADDLSTSNAATAAREKCDVAIESVSAAHGSPVIVDALFGTGLSRPLDRSLQAALTRLVGDARLSLAVDLPSGVATDDGAVLGDVPCFDLTLALGALKPAHMLQPAASKCGTVRLIDIGLNDVASQCRVLAKPGLVPPAIDAHKYSRGLVAVVGGAMPGASTLAAEAALRAGAGYVLLFSSDPSDAPHALVRKKWSVAALGEALDGKKAVSIVVGPGLGCGKDAAAKLDAAIATDRPLVIDGDALHLLDARRTEALASRRGGTVLTPHAGEFKAAFGDYTGSKIDAARQAAARSGATIVFKGPDTVIASPDGEVIVAAAASSWLSTAGTGDVLAGATGAMVAAGNPPEAAVWMHAESARRLGGAFIADDLARELSAVRAAL